MNVILLTILLWSLLWIEAGQIVILIFTSVEVLYYKGQFPKPKLFEWIITTILWPYILFLTLYIVIGFKIAKKKQDKNNEVWTKKIKDLSKSVQKFDTEMN